MTVTVRAASLVLTRSETLSTPDGGDRFTTNAADAQPVGMSDLDSAIVTHETSTPHEASAAHDTATTTTLAVTVPALSWSVFELSPAEEPANV